MQEFIVHKFFATKSSKFFQAALKRDWKEAREKRVPLPETIAEDFQMYLGWLYTIHMATLDYHLRVSSTTLVRLYILGDYLGDDRFCNNVIDTLVKNCSWTDTGMTFTSSDIDLAWDKTASGSTLQRVLVDFILCDLESDVFAPKIEDKGAWSKEVSTEVFRRLAEYACVHTTVSMARVSLSDNQDVCEYHRHDEEYPKCSGLSE